jgi:hypothetical protein
MQSAHEVRGPLSSWAKLRHHPKTLVTPLVNHFRFLLDPQSVHDYNHG